MKRWSGVVEMKSDTPIEYASLQLSPKRSRYELVVPQSGNFERLSSGLVKPFTTHLKVVEENVASSAQSIELKVDKRANGSEAWFTKGTLERFVRFVNTPEILEQINNYDAEMSQLEAALRIYSEILGDQSKNASGAGAKAAAAADATKRELIRAIDVRLAAVKKEMMSVCVRASSAGFNPDTISYLQAFGEQFGAPRLIETCEKLTRLWQRRPDLVKQTWQKKKTNTTSAVRTSICSDDPTDDYNPSSGTHLELLKPQKAGENVNNESSPSLSDPSSIQAIQPSRRLSVQDRINLFENKQKETSGGKPAVPAPEKSVLRRLSSDVSASTDRTVLRKWSDISIDLSGDKISESPVCKLSSSSVSVDKSCSVSGIPEDSINDLKCTIDSTNSVIVDRSDRDGCLDVGGEGDLNDQAGWVPDQVRFKNEQFRWRGRGSFLERQKISSVDASKDAPGTGKTASAQIETAKVMLSHKEEETGCTLQTGVNLRKTGDFPSITRDSFVPH